MIIVLAITLLLVRGTRESARANLIMVGVKLLILVFFIIAAFTPFNSGNIHPFTPNGLDGDRARSRPDLLRLHRLRRGLDRERGVEEPGPRPADRDRGLAGDLHGVLHPGRDRRDRRAAGQQLGESDAPLATALEEGAGLGWAAALLAFGALIAITSVVLVILYGQTRIIFAMCRDGLMPQGFADVSPRYGTPARLTLTFGSLIAVLAAFVPLSEIVKLVNIGIRAAASIADRASQENRAVGMTVNVGRTAFLPPDRGGRQHLKIMQLLAAVEADGSSPLVETLISTVGRLRRGMTAVIITASLDPAWVRPLAALRTRGVACVVVTWTHPRTRSSPPTRRPPRPARPSEPDTEADEIAAKRTRALRHALAEYELRVLPRHPGRGARRGARPMNRRQIPLAPAEGWVTLALVTLMCVVVALAIDDARWVLGQRGLPRPAGLTALGGVLVRVHRPEGRLGPLADVSHRRDLRGTARAAPDRPGAYPQARRRQTLRRDRGRRGRRPGST